jgi:hypothetical protein
MRRSYTSSPPSAFMACSGTALALIYSIGGNYVIIQGDTMIEYIYAGHINFIGGMQVESSWTICFHSELYSCF